MLNRKVPEYYMYCIGCLMFLVVTALEKLARHEYWQVAILLTAAAFCFYDAIKIKLNIDE